MLWQVKLQPKSVITTQVIVLHPTRLEEPQLSIKPQRRCVYTLCLQDNLINILLHSVIELIKQFLSNFQSAILLQHHQHGDVGLLGVDCVVVADYTPDDLVLVVSHDSQLWPVGQKVVVCVNRVGLRQLLPQHINNPVQLFLHGETLQFNLLSDT